MNSDFREAGEDVLELGLETGRHDVLSIVVTSRGRVADDGCEAAHGEVWRGWGAASGNPSVT